MSLTEQLTKGVNYKTKQVSQPKAVKQSRSDGLKNTSLTERLTKGVNYKAKQVSRPKAVKQSRSAGPKGAPVHEAASTRRVCLTPHIHVAREARQHGIGVLGTVEFCYSCCSFCLLLIGCSSVANLLLIFVVCVQFILL